MAKAKSTKLSTIRRSTLDLTRYSKGSDDSAPSFLPRFQLFTSGKAVSLSLVKAGEYGSPGKDESGDLTVEQIGSPTDILILAARDKAIDFNYDGKNGTKSYFDPTSEEFQSIERRASKKDSQCSYGPSIMVYSRTTGKLYEWHCANKTSKTIFEDLAVFMGISQEQADELGIEACEPKPITLSSVYIDPEGVSYSYFAPRVTACSTPIDISDSVQNSLEKALDNFYSEGEVEDTEDSDGR
jgi:hypothetical protein